MHEIITLQFGQASNYLATHFWNAQESYFTYSEDAESPVNHDVHWRPGIGADGTETFMPRTVIYDLKGGFGSLRRINALYEGQDDSARPPQSLWDGRTVVQRETPIDVAAYQQSLDLGGDRESAAELLTPATVRYWSDFNRVFFHPRSAVQLNEFDLNSSMRPFEKWATGEDLFASLDKEHDLLDRDLRPFVEEADHMQGVQVFTTIDDAWSGFAARYAERMRDEYGKSVVWIWALQDPHQGLNREKRLSRLANKAHALTELYKQASLLVPFSIPRPQLLPRHISMDPSSRWHTSALLTTAIETVAIPSRLRGAQHALQRLDGMADWLNGMGKQTIASMRLEVATGDGSEPGVAATDSRQRRAARREDELAEDTNAETKPVNLPVDLAAHDELETQTRQRGGAKQQHVFGQIVSFRGVATGDEDEPEKRESTSNYVRQQDSGRAAVKKYHTDLRFPQPDSFPRIYRATPSGEPAKGDIPVVASLTTESATSDQLKLLRSTVARSIGLEDREDLSNELAQMAEEYHEGWSSGSDEGDDE